MLYDFSVLLTTVLLNCTTALCSAFTIFTPRVHRSAPSGRAPPPPALRILPCPPVSKRQPESPAVVTLRPNRKTSTMTSAAPVQLCYNTIIILYYYIYIVICTTILLYNTTLLYFIILCYTTPIIRCCNTSIILCNNTYIIVCYYTSIILFYSTSIILCYYGAMGLCVLVLHYYTTTLLNY